MLILNDLFKGVYIGVGNNMKNKCKKYANESIALTV
jgi:hypothetical protein